jgi:glycosyltransferase involved in cell wall biosynthesis
VGGVPEFITSDEHGLLVPPGDKEALAEAALCMCDDSLLREAWWPRAGRWQRSSA